MIMLRTLGELSLTATDDGREIQSVLAQPKRLALLAYLASTRTPEFVSRSALVGLLWTERKETRARNALRTSLSFLRRALGPNVLVARGEHEVGLDRARLRCDASEFEAALEAGEDVQALELYRGEYLPGLLVDDALEFERWVEGERQRLRLRARDAARRLAETAMALGEGSEAERRARRAVALDPWDEATLRLLMRVLRQRGNRAGALRAYERFADRAREELRLEPSSDTKALVKRIREGGAATGAVSAEGGPEASGDGDPNGREQTPQVSVLDAGQAAGRSTAAGTQSSAWRSWTTAALIVVAAGAFAILTYRARSMAPSAALTPTGSWGRGSIKAITVLPFGNLSPDSSDAYLAEAMTDQVASALSVVPGFQVTSSTGTSKFSASPNVALPRIADSLGVHYVVEGNVLRSGDTVAVTARLVDSRADRTLWTGRFARSVREAEHSLVEIARSIAASLRSSFTRQDEARIAASQTADPVAHSLYLRAVPLTAPVALDSLPAAQAVSLLRRAVSLDSSFAAAWFRLGRAYQWLPGRSDSARIAFDRAVRAARLPSQRLMYRALRAQYLGQRDSALVLAQQAVRLNPENPDLIWKLSEAFKWHQDLPDALLWERKARDLDPLNAARWDALGFTYQALYLDRRAERAFRRAIAIDSADEDGWSGLANQRTLHGHYRGALALEDTFDAITGMARDPYFRGQIYVWMGEERRGRKLLEPIVAKLPWNDAVWRTPELVRALLLTGDTAAADSLARRADVTLRQISARVKLLQAAPAVLVELTAIRGQGAEAARLLRSLVKAPTRRAYRWLLDDPDFSTLRSDTAFQAALAELKGRVMRQRQEVLRVLDQESGG